MEYKRGRYSKLLRPFLIVFDLFIINFLAFELLNLNVQESYFFPSDFLNNKYFLFFIYSTSLWFLSTFLLKFYNVYRYTSVLNIATLLFKQIFVFMIIVFAFEGAFRSINTPAIVTLKYLFYVFIIIGSLKLLSFYILKTYRLYLKGNIRDIILVGSNDNAKELLRIFNKNKELGYHVKGVFGQFKEKGIMGTIEDSLMFLETNTIDEIYCSIDELTEKQVNDYVKYADTHHCNIKFIPNTNRLLDKRLKMEYYGYLPVLSIQEVAINNSLNKALKRSFDVVFSLLVIVFILSWLTPLLAILIKLESKGPVFYKHRRNGINYKEFICYKYRSLTITKELKGTYVKPNDDRLTQVGKFLRRTNMDELPQFFNVFFGDMSVVGPRPHMPTYTEDYSKKINRYDFIFRHHVKPGITGLAQVKGYRGEIEKDKDIINRIKYDIFYIENWSLLLDIKIIFLTFTNAIKGEEKAY
ncbi:exopolysaccharide biosynthesis polyprenyl glycosylphosphotransferase [Aestuariivivens marinum]|uniref:exopolysaccharide biosynthesis polyprenyl glycosylphosphotransferase n=1 Tax=Aestuariivivens marinum TaxID=2913555 RepID=UPI001F580625|nr:exopolysaccharide biosynthesis polyprenyl glycosylphosphotransferase [Aestuariivivens marinum]